MIICEIFYTTEPHVVEQMIMCGDNMKEIKDIFENNYPEYDVIYMNEVVGTDDIEEYNKYMYDLKNGYDMIG